MTVIERKSPEVGNFSAQLLASFGICQTARINNLVHFSGVVAANHAGECVSPGNIRGQVLHIPDTYKKLLDEEGMSFANILSVTVFTTDIAQLTEHISLFTAAFEGNPPTSTWVEVKALFSPEFMLEVVAIAAD